MTMRKQTGTTPRKAHRLGALVGVALTGLLVSMLGVQAASAGPEATQAQIEKGKALAFNRTKGNCLACHEIAGGKLTGTVGPALKDMKTRYPDRDVLFKRVWDETKFNPMTAMPPFGRHKILTREEIERIVDYLYTL